MSGKRPHAEGAGGAVKTRKTAEPKKNHCPPYLPESTRAGTTPYDEIVKGDALIYFQLIGKCQCTNGANGIAGCRVTHLTRFNFTPWTRFPILNDKGEFGGYLHAPNVETKFKTFEAWWNPTGHKGNTDVQTQVNAFLIQDTVNGVQKLCPNYARGREKVYKWEKFWLAVHVLFEWVNRRFVVDENTLRKCIKVYFASAKDLERSVNGPGPKERYVQAGILAPESEELKTLYREFRTDLTLQPDEKTALMNFLLEEKRKVVLLFSKAELLMNMQTHGGLRQVYSPLATVLILPINICFAQDEKPGAKPGDKPDDTQEDAVQALLDLGGGTGGGAGGSAHQAHTCTGPGGPQAQCRQCKLDALNHVSLLLVKLQELQF